MYVVCQVTQIKPHDLCYIYKRYYINVSSTFVLINSGNTALLILISSRISKLNYDLMQIIEVLLWLQNSKR